MDVAQLAALRPADIDEALADMRTALAFFDAKKDRRAYFVRVYLMMTQEVHAAVNGKGKFEGHPVFMDPEWIRRLSGKFASRYFLSLDEPQSRAWKAAHGAAAERSSTVLENVLLGINAHINYDLAQAIAANLDPKELDDENVMLRRKFDHDQVNNLLERSVNRIQTALATEYEPVLALGDHLLGGLDEQLSDVGLKHYRAHVWGDALTFASAQVAGDDDVELVRAKLDWESGHLAKEIRSWGFLWRVERWAGAVWSIVRRPHWGRFDPPVVPRQRQASDRLMADV